jgi:hypothetical protein
VVSTLVADFMAVAASMAVVVDISERVYRARNS